MWFIGFIGHQFTLQNEEQKQAALQRVRMQEERLRQKEFEVYESKFRNEKEVYEVVEDIKLLPPPKE